MKKRQFEVITTLRVRQVIDEPTPEEAAQWRETDEGDIAPVYTAEERAREVGNYNAAMLALSMPGGELVSVEVNELDAEQAA